MPTSSQFYLHQNNYNIAGKPSIQVQPMEWLNVWDNCVQ